MLFFFGNILTPIPKGDIQLNKMTHYSKMIDNTKWKTLSPFVKNGAWLEAFADEYNTKLFIMQLLATV